MPKNWILLNLSKKNLKFSLIFHCFQKFQAIEFLENSMIVLNNGTNPANNQPGSHQSEDSAESPAEHNGEGSKNTEKIVEIFNIDKLPTWLNNFVSKF